MTHNPNCDGAHCRSATGEVRVYPLGGGGNLIICRACWTHENNFRRARGLDTGAAENWPTIVWATAEIYRVGSDSAPDDRHLLDGVRATTNHPGIDWFVAPEEQVRRVYLLYYGRPVFGGLPPIEKMRAVLADLAVKTLVRPI